MPGRISVQLRIYTPGLAEEMKRLISSLEGFFLTPSKLLEHGDLLIFEIGENLQEEIHSLHSLSHSGRVREIFVISPPLAPDFLIQVRRAGASRVFIRPVKRAEILSSLLELKEKETPESSLQYKKYGKILYLLGCKGGVGTTTVALNLASGLAHLDKSQSVLLVDMNPLGDLAVLLGVNATADWAQLTKNLSRINAKMVKTILTRHPSGFYVLPTSSPLENPGQNPEITEKIFSLVENAFEFLVIDGGKFSGEISAWLFERADTILLLANLTQPCLEKLTRLLAFFQKLKPCPEEKVKIIINRYEKKSFLFISLEEAEIELRKHIFWTIPNDFSSAMEAATQGKTLIDLGEEKEIRRSFLNLASFFLAREIPGGKSGRTLEAIPDRGRLYRLATSLHLKPRTS